MTLPIRVRPVRVLCAEDDPDDRALVRDALTASRLPSELRFVKDGEELMDYLKIKGGLGDPVLAPRPDIIFLDLWMPRKDGREALKEIKTNPSLRQIPVVVLTTSRAEEDVFRSYDLGASSFVRKTATFEALVEVMKAVGKYWFEIVDLPKAPRS
jgi:two-component system, response regulator